MHNLPPPAHLLSGLVVETGNEGMVWDEYGSGGLGTARGVLGLTRSEGFLGFGGGIGGDEGLGERSLLNSRVGKMGFD